MKKPILAASAGLAVATLALAGCVENTPSSESGESAAAGAITVNSTDTDCTVSANEATSGTVTFEVTNAGTQITEFYLMADDGLRIVSEVENIVPGQTSELTLTAQPGSYYTLCKPGMVGDGVGQAAFTVTGDKVAISGDDAEVIKEAIDLYAAFVKDQVSQLLPQVQKFVKLYENGDDEKAQAMFPEVRKYYERIEPVAESLGDLDPKIDYREVDAVAEGLDWTGFHRIEKDLWVPKKDALNADGETNAWKDWEPSSDEQRKEIGDQLVADVQELYDYVYSDEFTTKLEEGGIAELSNGAKSLLDEVATGKITGEEDWWSGTDLWDFAANVEGSKMAYDLVHDLLVTKDGGQELADQVDEEYQKLNDLLAKYGSLDDGFVNYSELTDADKKALTDQINATTEPVSQITAVLLG